MPNIQSILTSFIALALCYNVSGKDDKTTSPIVVTKGGEVTYNADERGNRVLDFSFCGYRQQTDSIPDLPANGQGCVVPYLSAKARSCYPDRCASQPQA